MLDTCHNCNFVLCVLCWARVKAECSAARACAAHLYLSVKGLVCTARDHRRPTGGAYCARACGRSRCRSPPRSRPSAPASREWTRACAAFASSRTRAFCAPRLGGLFVTHTHGLWALVLRKCVPVWARVYANAFPVWGGAHSTRADTTRSRRRGCPRRRSHRAFRGAHTRGRACAGFGSFVYNTI